MQAISPADLTARNSWRTGVRGLYRSSRVRKGRYREMLARKRLRGRISSEMEPERVGKEM
jgi:hypothetical protein